MRLSSMNISAVHTVSRTYPMQDRAPLPHTGIKMHPGKHCIRYRFRRKVGSPGAHPARSQAHSGQVILQSIQLFFFYN